MPRRPRNVQSGTIYHVYNHGLERRRLFESDEELAIAVRFLATAKREHDVTLLGYSITPHHWHVVASQRTIGELSRFVATFTRAHAVRLRSRRDTVGQGAIYRGRFRSYPLRGADEVLRALRFVESDAVREELVERAEHWRFASLHQRMFARDPALPVLEDVALPADWPGRVNQPLADKQIAEIERALQSGRPYGEARPYVRVPRHQRRAWIEASRFLA